MVQVVARHHTWLQLVLDTEQQKVSEHHPDSSCFAFMCYVPFFFLMAWLMKMFIPIHVPGFKELTGHVGRGPEAFTALVVYSVLTEIHILRNMDRPLDKDGILSSWFPEIIQGVFVAILCNLLPLG